MIRFENVLKRSLQDVLKTSWRRLQNVLNKSWRCLEDVLKTSWRRLEDVWPRRIYWSWPKRLQDVLKTSWRRLENVLKTSWRRMTKTSILVLIKTSSEDVWVRRIYSSWWRRLQDVFWRQRRKTSSRRLQDVFIKTNVCWVNIELYIISTFLFYTLSYNLYLNYS